MLHEAVELAEVPLEYLQTRMLGVQRMLNGVVKLETEPRVLGDLLEVQKMLSEIHRKLEGRRSRKCSVELWTWLWALWNI